MYSVLFVPRTWSRYCILFISLTLNYLNVFGLLFRVLLPRVVHIYLPWSPKWMQQKVGLRPSNYFHGVFSCQYCIDFQNNIYCRKSMESVTTLFLLLFLMRVQQCFISVMSLDTCLCKMITRHRGKQWQPKITYSRWLEEMLATPAEL